MAFSKKKGGGGGKEMERVKKKDSVGIADYFVSNRSRRFAVSSEYSTLRMSRSETNERRRRETSTGKKKGEKGKRGREPQERPPTSKNR